MSTVTNDARRKAVKQTASAAAGLISNSVCGPVCGFAGSYVAGVMIDYIYAYVDEEKTKQGLEALGRDLLRPDNDNFKATAELFTGLLKDLKTRSKKSVLQVAAGLVHDAGSRRNKHTPLLAVHVAVTMVTLWRVKTDDLDVPEKEVSDVFLRRCLLTTTLHSHFQEKTVQEVYSVACELDSE
eukprot:TRINITY_DN66936_c8_g4_i1.p1 TRINITY_DN66936_c8_g4~~TRINITY_DN66936_c8_g4_i1.p1  ORF type:complete len:183 (-),score=14.08 TRINITY_DN66936_c8_g4_i1:63-611(-)